MDPSVILSGFVALWSIVVYAFADVTPARRLQPEIAEAPYETNVSSDERLGRASPASGDKAPSEPLAPKVEARSEAGSPTQIAPQVAGLKAPAPPPPGTGEDVNHASVYPIPSPQSMGSPSTPESAAPRFPGATPHVGGPAQTQSAVTGPTVASSRVRLA